MKTEVLPHELPESGDPQQYINFFDRMIESEKKPCFKVFNWHTGEFEEIKNEDYQDVPEESEFQPVETEVLPF